MRKWTISIGLMAACGGGPGATVVQGPPTGGVPPGGGNVCDAAQAEQGVVGLWRFEGATCGDEQMPMEAPAFEEEIEVSVAWPAYSMISHTFIREGEKLCRFRVDRRVEPGGNPQRVVETGRWAELAGAQGWTPASAEACPSTAEPALDGELRLEAESLLLTLSGPSFCPGKPWVFRYKRIPCAAQ